MLPFKQRANNIHFPEAEQKGRMLKLKLKQLFGFFAFGAPARSLAPFSSVGRCVCQCSPPFSGPSPRPRAPLLSPRVVEPLRCQVFHAMAAAVSPPPTTYEALRPSASAPPLAVSTSPLPKPRPAGSLSFSPLQLYCILHAPNLKGGVQKFVEFDMNQGSLEYNFL